MSHRLESKWKRNGNRGREDRDRRQDDMRLDDRERERSNSECYSRLPPLLPLPSWRKYLQDEPAALPEMSMLITKSHNVYMNANIDEIKKCIDEITQKIFTFNYIPRDNKGIAYYKNTLGFCMQFLKLNHKPKLDLVIDKIITRGRKFLLIDGENLFHPLNQRDIPNITHNIEKTFTNENYDFVIIFGQEHRCFGAPSRRTPNDISKTGSFYGLDTNEMVGPNRNNVFVFHPSDQDANHKDIRRFLPTLPSNTEADDIMILYVFNQIINAEKHATILSNDGFKWYKNGTLGNKLNQVKVTQSFKGKGHKNIYKKKRKTKKRKTKKRKTKKRKTDKRKTDKRKTYKRKRNRNKKPKTTKDLKHKRAK